MIASALAASTSGILLRLVDAANGWQILSYRSAAFAALFLLLVLVRYRGTAATAFRGIGWIGVGAAFCLALTYIAYLSSMLLTTIAAAVVVFSAAPFFAGALGILFLKERPQASAWVWMALAVAGIVVMMSENFDQAAISAQHQLGVLVALGAAFGYAVGVVFLRLKRTSDLTPAFVLAGLIAFGISAGIAGDLTVSAHDAALAIALGIVSLGLQYLFIHRAAYHLQAAEITLIALVEVILSPLWVWIGVGETPGWKTVIGGALVVAAVTAQSLTGLREPLDTCR